MKISLDDVILITQYDSIMSPWYKCEILGKEQGVKFTSMAHYYTYLLSEVCDISLSSAILKETNDEKIKILLNYLKNNYYQTFLDKDAELLAEANYRKHENSENFTNLLLTTENKNIIYCSQVDTVWGATMTKDRFLSPFKQEWFGGNSLGIVLSVLRAVLKEERM